MNKFINKKPFFIAEISGNHNGKLSVAKKLIYFAKKYGADAVKLQTYTPDMMTLKSTNFKIKSGLWKNKNLWNLYNKAHTPLEWHKELYRYAKEIKIKIFSTPFSVEAVKFLETLNTKIYKISSFEMNDTSLLKEVALTKKPIILSTGLANFKEIKESIKILKKYGSKNITLLYCVSEYPSKKNDFNLNNITSLKEKFKCEVGLSDHSIGSDIACMSIIKGANIIEKHICLKNVKAVDSKFSLNQYDIKNFVRQINLAFNLINNKKLEKKKSKNNKFRRSIYAIKNIKKGEKFTKNNIKTFRPNIGLSAKYYLDLLNKKSPIDIKINCVLKQNILNR